MGYCDDSPGAIEMATKVYKKKVYKKTAYKKKAAATGGAKVKKMERQLATVMTFVKDLTPDAQHAVLWGQPVNTMLFSDGEYAGQCYFRVPVTAAIPMQRPGIDPITQKVANPDDWRKGISCSALFRMSCRRLGRDEYTIGWICALPVELKAARALLDEQHELPVQRDGDNNSYTVGRIGAHNVVIAVLPAGRIGTNPAATIGSDMSSSFRNLRFALMVGIGGGVPSDKHDIRLGDVVISVPTGRCSGVIQYDMGKALANDLFEPLGLLNMPPLVVLTTINTLRSLNRETLFKHLSVFHVTSSHSEHPYPGSEKDQLFKAEYKHRFSNDDTCDRCNKLNLVTRSKRDSHPFYHYGTIASGNLVIRDGLKRDKLQKEHGILCFEMEAAGLMNTFPCLAIRGICDYSDSYKNKSWQPYAAATAAAYAKVLLEYIPSISLLTEPVLLTEEGKSTSKGFVRLTRISFHLPLNPLCFKSPPSSCRNLRQAQIFDYFFCVLQTALVNASTNSSG